VTAEPESDGEYAAKLRQSALDSALVRALDIAEFTSALRKDPTLDKEALRGHVLDQRDEIWQQTEHLLRLVLQARPAQLRRLPSESIRPAVVTAIWLLDLAALVVLLVVYHDFGNGRATSWHSFASGVLLMGLLVIPALLTQNSPGGEPPAVRTALQNYRVAVRDQQVIPRIREAFNELGTPADPSLLRPVDAPGLSEQLDPQYEVATSAARRLLDRVASVSSASLGIAGPRGVGKSTLLRALCSGRLTGGVVQGRPQLGIYVPAPVRYEASEFIPFLFAELCREIAGPLERQLAVAAARHEQLRLRLLVTMAGAACGVFAAAGISAAAGRTPSSLALSTAGFGAGSVLALFAVFLLWGRAVSGRRTVRTPLQREALRHLQSLRYLETTTNERSTGATIGSWTLGVKDAKTLAGQPLTLPEVLGRYKEFLAQVTETRRVVIGIDELDRIASTADAQRFLNDIKGLFGQPGCFYVVSVSEDAMAAFDRRGFPLRDAFDSAFDEVVYVDYLTADESAELLDRRVTDLPMPARLACHVLAGGLPREVIRVARDVVAAGRDGPVPLVDGMEQVLRSRLERHLRTLELAATARLRPDGDHPLLRWCHSLPRSEGSLLLNATAVESICAQALASEQDLVELLLGFATDAYQSDTLLVLSRRLAKAPASDGHGDDDALDLVTSLTASRQALALSPARAWDICGETRALLGLKPTPYPVAELLPAGLT
jgi:hypothetical protein